MSTDDAGYIHNGTEVRLTGRIASKKTTNKMSGSNKVTILTLHEITPKQPDVDGTWCLWVNLEDLFVIQEGQ